MNTYFSRSLRFFVGFASIGLSVTFIKAYAHYFNAFFLALVIVMSVSPIMFWLRKHGVPNWLAMGVGMVITLSMTALLAIVIALSVMRTSEILPQIVEQIDVLTEALDRFLGRFGTQTEAVVELIEPNQLFFFGRQVLDTVLESVSLFFLTILIIFFMLIEAMAFPQKVESQLAQGNPQFLTAYRFADNIRQYVGITSLLGIIGGTIIGLVLYLMKVDFAAMWGILYFILNYVPMVGFWLAMIPPALVALLGLGPGAMVVVILVYLVISTIINQILRPAFMRGGLDLSPLWSVLSLVIWAAILGPPGLIVGVPLTIAIKELVIATDENNQWINDLISAGTAQQEMASAFATTEMTEAKADGQNEDDSSAGAEKTS